LLLYIKWSFLVKPLTIDGSIFAGPKELAKRH